MSDPQTESRLIQRAQSGDSAAFDAILEAYRPRLAAFVLDRLGENLRTHLDVDDVLQETSLRSFRAFDRFESRGGESLFRWLAGIAINIIREEARKVLERPWQDPEAEPIGQDVSRFTALRREERFERLQEALKGLPPDYQEVIRLTRLEKLPPDDVARRLHRSRQATRNLLFRALRSLKDSFGDTESLHLPPRSLRDGE